MKMRQIAIGLIAAAFLSAPAFAQTLWQNVSFGMSIEDVRAAQPDAILPTEPDEYANETRAELHIPDFTLEELQFDVGFLFRGGKLTSVSMAAEGKPAKIDYDRLVGMLRNQHGPETSGGKTVLGYETKWDNANGVTVRIIYLSEYTRLLRIGYAPAPA